ncbi:MAG: hypothetical protein Q7R56_03655, partial [Nanoarchaeota archaeon]|nr:hypothetical protein [Nanoarchaeota archaeon]
EKITEDYQHHLERLQQDPEIDKQLHKEDTTEYYGTALLGLSLGFGTTIYLQNRAKKWKIRNNPLPI